jgi:hypothetical protein
MSEEQQPQKIEQTIDAAGLHEELERAGLPIAGVDSSGKVSWSKPPSGLQTAQAAQILAAHKGNAARAERRAQAGITTDAMIAALWEKIFLGKDHKAQELLAKMAELELSD